VNFRVKWFIEAVQQSALLSLLYLEIFETADRYTHVTSDYFQHRQPLIVVGISISSDTINKTYASRFYYTAQV
jgi:hypothetical protein